MWYNKPGFSKEVGIDAKGFLVDKGQRCKKCDIKKRATRSSLTREIH